MENTTTPKSPNTHITYGLITGFVGIAIFIILYAFNLYTKSGLGYISTVAFLALIIAATVSHSNAMSGNVTFGDLFATGFKTAVIATLINIAFLFIFVILVPSYKEAIMEVSRQAMIAKNLPQDQIDSGMQMVNRFFMVGLIGFGLLGSLVVGAVAALIGAGVAKKNPDFKKIS